MKLRFLDDQSESLLRRGAIAVQVALSLTVLMGVAAVAVDGGVLMAERRHAQAAADAAALAGAVDLFKNWPKNAGVDKSGTAKASATAFAKSNYYKDVTNLTINSINIPPQTALNPYFNNKVGYIEVNLTYNQKRGFSAIWGSARIPVRAHAIARGQWVLPGYGVITLDPTGVRTLNTNGQNTNLTVNGGTVIVNSNNTSAVDNSGTIKAAGTNVTGNYTGGGTYTPAPSTGTPPVEDPLKALPTPAPPPAAPALTGTRKVSLGSGNFKYTLGPGSYDGNGGPVFPALKSGDVAVFEQASANSAGGIFYLYKGLSSTGATLTMDTATNGGLMFYNASTKTSEGFTISGNATGSVNLSGLTSGTYQGILYFQARGSTQDVSVTGNGTFVMLGTFYAPDAGLKITGTGTSSTIGSQYIAKNLTLGGSGAIVVDYNSGLLAPVRKLNLVE